MKKLPSLWTSTTLGDVTAQSVSKEGPKGNGEFTYVDISSLENRAKRIVSPKNLSVSDAPTRARQRLRAGDVLVSMTRPNLNAVALVPSELDGAIGSTAFHVLRPITIEPRWLFYISQSHDFIDAMCGRVLGVVYPAVRPKDIVAYEIPLPPLAEQHRIVEEIEKQFTRLDAAIASLKRIQENLKRYRASVLKAACEGRLVPTEAELARKEGRDYEPAHKLLERILKERRAKWEADELARMRAKGKQPRDGKWKDRYKDPVSPDSGLPGPPEGWRWSCVSQIAFVESGQTPKGVEERARSSGQIPWLKVGDMNRAGNERYIVNADSWLLERDAEQLGMHVRPVGTIIFPKRGGAIATNKKRILSQPSCYDLNTMGLIPHRDIALYLWWWFQTVNLAPLGDGSNVPQINHGDIEPLLVALPPLAEQKRITQEVEQRCSIIAAMESSVGTDLWRAERLRQSILKRAFEGKLVPQDPNDEPASALLDRIKAEREKAEAIGNTSPRRTRPRKKAFTKKEQMMLPLKSTIATRRRRKRPSRNR